MKSEKGRIDLRPGPSSAAAAPLHLLLPVVHRQTSAAVVAEVVVAAAEEVRPTRSVFWPVAVLLTLLPRRPDPDLPCDCKHLRHPTNRYLLLRNLDPAAAAADGRYDFRRRRRRTPRCRRPIGAESRKVGLASSDGLATPTSPPEHMATA